MSFEGKYSDFSGSTDEWKEVWQIAHGGDHSVWRPYITDENWKASCAAFFQQYKSKNINILSADSFDKKYKDLKDPNVEGNVSGVTVKTTEVVREGNKNVVIPPHITLRAEKEDRFNKTTFMFCALHEVIHWLSFPPNQGTASKIRTVLHDGLTEALVSVVVDEVLITQGFSMTKLQQGSPAADIRAQDPKSYLSIMPIVNRMIALFGYKLFGEALFIGNNDALEAAMQVKWKLGNTKSFYMLMKPLWTAADSGQRDQATKNLAALMAR